MAGGAASGASLVTRLGVEGLDTYKRGMKSAGDEVDKFAKRTNSSLMSAGQAMTGLGRTMTTHLTLPIVAGAGLALKSAADLDLSLHKINSLTGLTGPAAEKSFKMFSSQVKALSNNLGIAQKTLSDGLYQAISSGIPRENAMEFMTVASKAAIAGVTDTETAVDGISTAMNAFKDQSLSAKDAADQMFMAVNIGKTEFPDLASQIGQAAPFVDAAKVKFKDFMAAMATMTSKGINTRIAVTDIKMAMSSMLKPTEDLQKAFKKMGVDGWDGLLKKSGSMQNAFKAINDSAGGNKDKLISMIGTLEGATAIMDLTGSNAKDAASAMDGLNHSAGAAGKAFDEINKSDSRKFEMMKVDIQNAAIAMGQDLMPAALDIAQTIKELTDKFSNLSPETQHLIEELLGVAAAAGPTLLVLGNMTKAIGMIAAATGGIEIGPLAALGGAALVASGQFGSMHDIVKGLPGLLDGARDGVQALGQGARDAADGFMKMQHASKDTSKNTQEMADSFRGAGMLAGAVLTKLGQGLGLVSGGASKAKHEFQGMNQIMANAFGPGATLAVQLYANVIKVIGAAGSVKEGFHQMGISIKRGMLEAGISVMNLVQKSAHIAGMIPGPWQSAFKLMDKAASKASQSMSTELAQIDSSAKTAKGGVDSLKASMDNLHSKTVTVNVKGTNTKVSANPGAPMIFQHHAMGGKISGKGTGNSDDIPAMLSNGEFVVKADGSNLADAMQFYGATGYAGGGFVYNVNKPTRTKGEKQAHYDTRLRAWQDRRDAAEERWNSKHNNAARFDNKASGFDLEESRLEGGGIAASATPGSGDNLASDTALRDMYQRKYDQLKAFMSKKSNMRGVSKADKAKMQQALNAAAQSVNQFSQNITEYATTEQDRVSALAAARAHGVGGLSDDAGLADIQRFVQAFDDAAAVAKDAQDKADAAEELRREALGLEGLSAERHREELNVIRRANGLEDLKYISEADQKSAEQQADDLRARLAQSKEKQDSANANFKNSQAQFATLNGSGDIGMGGKNAYQAAGGHTYNIYALDGNSPAIQTAIANNSNGGNAIGGNADIMYTGRTMTGA